MNNKNKLPQIDFNNPKVKEYLESDAFKNSCKLFFDKMNKKPSIFFKKSCACNCHDLPKQDFCKLCDCSIKEKSRIIY